MCGEHLCPRPPSWSNWGPWESCSSACPEDGEGTQQRRRVCLETGNMEATCDTLPPPGPIIQTSKCTAPEGVSCANTVLGQWTTWSKCDLTCSNSEDTGIQTRWRKCSSDSNQPPENETGPGPESKGSCFALQESARKQFRVCPNLPSCPIGSCHDGWWKSRKEGKYFKGCADPEAEGRYYCPGPGGVDGKGLLKSNGPLHICTDDEIDEAKDFKRVRRSTGENHEEKFQEYIDECLSNEDDPDCGAVNSIFGDMNTKKDRTEDLEFMKPLISLVGWDPLTKDDESYKSPYVKFVFFQEVLHALPEFVRQCRRETPRLNAKQSGKKCSNIEEGKTTFLNEMDSSVEEIKDVAKRLNKASKDIAAAKIAASTTAAAAGVAGTVTAIIGAFFGK